MAQHGEHRPLVKAGLLVWLTALPAMAEPFVHASVSADLTGDGWPELAVVVGERDLALAIWSENRETYQMDLLAHGPAVGWTQLNEDARLEVSDEGSLRLITSNFGIGRNKWEEILTIAWRAGAFRVAGLTHSAFDSLDIEAGEKLCDVNFLTGTGTSNFAKDGGVADTRRLALDAPAPPIEDWSPERFWETCVTAE